MNSTSNTFNKPSLAGSLEGLLISHLVAASENNVIGRNNQLPWHLPNDFRYFKNKTWGMPVIMGRNTFNSLDNLLPGRFNIVITSQQDYNKDGVITAHSIDEAVEKAIHTDCKEIFIIGGGKIFEQSVDIINRIYLTRVHTTLDGDTFYPAIDATKWRLTYADKHVADDRHIFDYTFQTWEKN
jgi:dihydrofolate reductase